MIVPAILVGVLEEPVPFREEGGHLAEIVVGAIGDGGLDEGQEDPGIGERQVDATEPRSDGSVESLQVFHTDRWIAFDQ